MLRSNSVGTVAVFFFVFSVGSTMAQTKPRARDLGVPFDGTPGPLNAITDVTGVEVGHTTLISGEDSQKAAVVRTGVIGFRVVHPYRIAWEKSADIRFRTLDFIAGAAGCPFCNFKLRIQISTSMLSIVERLH